MYMYDRSLVSPKCRKISIKNNTLSLIVNLFYFFFLNCVLEVVLVDLDFIYGAFNALFYFRLRSCFEELVMQVSAYLRTKKWYGHVN